MTIEQKKTPPLAESVKRIFISIDRMTKQAVETAKILKQAQKELSRRESIIKNQAEEIERLRLLLERMDECGTTGEDASEMHMYVNEALRGSVDSWKSPC